MPKMYREDYDGVVDVHPSNVENMKNKGFQLEPIEKNGSDKKPKTDKTQANN